MNMAVSHSRMTSQGQVSVPADVRRALGLAPGSVLEWEQRGNELVVRKAGRHTCADLHAALFDGRPAQDIVDVKQGIRTYVRRKHARG